MKTPNEKQQRCTAPQKVARGNRYGAIWSTLFALGFAVVFLGGARGCTIYIQEDCPNLDEVCPDVQCDSFAVNAEGCAMCECADPEPVECFQDADCGPGEFCLLPIHGDPGEPVPEPAEPHGGEETPDSDGATEPGDSGDSGADFNDDGTTSDEPPHSDDAVGGVCVSVNCPAIMIDCAPGFEPVEELGDDGCPILRCEPVDDCASLDPDVCEETDGCRLEHIPVACDCAVDPDGNTDEDCACPALAEVICVPDEQNACEGLGPEECEARDDCEGIYSAVACTGAACVEGEECPPCEPSDEEFICVERRDPPPPVGCEVIDCAPGYTCEELTICEDEPCIEPDNGDGSTGSDGDEPMHCGGGCWTEAQCVPVEGHCDDGSFALCDMIPPVCEDGTILAIQNNCYACVDPFTCTEPGQNGCLDNADCGPGQHCEVTEVCPDCADEEPACLAPCFAEGICVDDTPVEVCLENADCSEGFRCATELDVCMLPPECEDPNNDGACLTVCYSQCVPIEDEPPPPPACTNDVDCGEGGTCWDGLCVYEEPAGCYSDQDCAQGESCTADTECLLPPGCDTSSGVDCPAVCYGRCEATP
jgi:Cys-rich repeat protein